MFSNTGIYSSKAESNTKLNESQDQSDSILKPATKPVNPHVGGFFLQNT